NGYLSVSGITPKKILNRFLVLPANMFNKLPTSAGLAAAFFLGSLLIYHQILGWVRMAVTES
ncbi:hypothetical protein ACYSJ0_14420, partial [Lactiplantibacillus plantarum]